MEKARDAVKNFVSKSGQHDTTIHERVAPAVQHENIERREHEETMPVIDRELHQDHYHTSEQPINDSEVLPEQHHHRAVAVEEKSFEHDNSEAVQRRLAEEQARYNDQRTRTEGEHTRSVTAAVEGERVHHHVHENIQPIINKQTVEPHVVHTTVPVHEVHHNAAQHHSASALPPVSMEDFKQQGGSLQGREERTDHFTGEPRHFGADAGATGHPGGIGLDGHGASTKHSNLDPSDVGRQTTSGRGNELSTTAGDSQHKPSLMDRLNPKTDANQNGKAGIMN